MFVYYIYLFTTHVCLLHIIVYYNYTLGLHTDNGGIQTNKGDYRDTRGDYRKPCLAYRGIGRDYRH